MKVIKRDGRIVDFDETKIEIAIQKALDAVNSDGDAKKLANAVKWSIEYYEKISIEEIQDRVERILFEFDEREAAKAFILYRDERAKIRSEVIPYNIRMAFEKSKEYFPTPIQAFQFYDKYARFNHEAGRRETWVETVKRAVAYLRELSGSSLPQQDYEDIENAILKMEVIPSMRLLAMAGEAARRQNVSLYNCSYMPVDSIDSFVEALIISMSGCGVGFSVESKYVNQLPEVQYQGIESKILNKVHVIEDTTEGWADALRIGLTHWFNGEDIKFDYSLIRPEGSILRVKGGRASGPKPLKILLDKAREIILSREGSKLSTLDAHDIMCHVGSAAVMGGTRRTAMISLFDMNDYEMRHCKDGEFWHKNPQRFNANNSIVIERQLSAAEVMKYVLDMDSGQTGEPGIFSRVAAKNTAPLRRQWVDFGTNPCGEIVLRPYQFCNLSAVVARFDDTEESLTKKVRLATIIGTIQSMATYFPNLRPIWKQNCEEERLLGIDITGQMDCRLITDSIEILDALRETAINTNSEYADLLGINPSAAITTVKPSGNSSQLLNCSSGIHERHSDYYIRRVRVSATSPIFKVLRDSKVPMRPENGYTEENCPTWVVSFPMKSPTKVYHKSAVEQLDYWADVKLIYTEHNPSATITYRPNEVIDIAEWLFTNQDFIGGISFLPKNDSKYEQMPYEEISEQEYNKLIAEFPVIDFANLYKYEKSDFTTAAQEVACVSGYCEI